MGGDSSLFLRLRFVTILCLTLPFVLAHPQGVKPRPTVLETDCSSRAETCVAEGERVELSRPLSSPGFKSGAVASFLLDLPYVGYGGLEPRPFKDQIYSLAAESDQLSHPIPLHSASAHDTRGSSKPTVEPPRFELGSSGLQPAA